MCTNDFVLSSRNVLKQYTGYATEVWSPDGVTKIAEKAFDQCEHIETVHIPDSVSDIGECAFRFCSNLKEVNLPSHLRIIKMSVFKGCRSLKKIILPSSVEAIKGSAFSQCASLYEICIPDSVTEIGNNAFFGCDNVQSITIPASQIPNLQNAFFSSATTTLTLTSTLSTDIDSSYFDCFKRLERIYAPMLMLSAINSKVKRLFVNGFVANPQVYSDAAKAEYAKYLNAQKKRLLPQAVADDTTEVFSAYEQLGIAIPESLCDELLKQATSEKKDKVRAWLTTFKNNQPVTSSNSATTKTSSTPKSTKSMKPSPEMREAKYVIEIGNIRFTVLNNVKQHMKKVRYNQLYDLLVAADHYMSDDEAEALGIDPLSIASYISPYVKENAPQLTADQIAERKQMFTSACYAAASIAGMKIIVQSASRKKDGTFTKNRIVHIATLQMVDQRANTWELFAKAVDDMTLEIGIRKIVCKDSEIERIKGLIGGQQDILATDHDFKTLCD